jgi:hypothetical protein
MLRMCEVIELIQTELGLDRRLTAHETLQQAGRQLGLAAELATGTLREAAAAVCTELGIADGSAVPGGSGLTGRGGRGAAAASSPGLSSASSSADSLKLLRLRDDAREAVGSYAKAAATKMRREQSQSSPALGGAAQPDSARPAANYEPQYVGSMAEALDRAAASDRPVFVTTRPAPKQAGSFAFHPSFILSQTKVLTKSESHPVSLVDAKQRAQQLLS